MSEDARRAEWSMVDLLPFAPVIPLRERCRMRFV